MSTGNALLRDLTSLDLQGGFEAAARPMRSLTDRLCEAVAGETRA